MKIYLYELQVGGNMITPILETNRLILRPFCIDDTQDVFECWESDPDVAKYMFWESHKDIKKTKEWIDSEIEKVFADDWYRWAVISKKTNELLGTGLIYFESEYNAFEIAYNFGKKFWKQGYATEAMTEIIGFAKNKLKLHEIVGRYAKENISSGNVMKKLGFEYIRDILYEANEGKNIYQGLEYRLKL